MLNSCIMMGRLTADPELRHTPNNAAVTSFTIAVDRSYSKAGTERQTDFFDVAAWNKTAEFISRYFRKGQLIAIQGRVETNSYEDKNGNKRKTYKIVAENVHFAEPKRNDYGEHNGFSTTQGMQAAPSESNPVYGQQTDLRSYNAEVDSDDDLPF